MQELLFTRSNGQTVAYFDYGQSENVVFWHHGTPAAGPLSPLICRNADASGLRIIEVVRPGYGNSTAISDRTVSTGSQIDLEIADLLGIEYFTVAGISGGGPHALASAHLAGSRCLALLIIAGLGPFDDPNFDFVAGLTEEDRKEWILPLTSMADFEVSVSKMAKEWASSDINQIKKILNVGPDDSSSDERISSFQAMMQYSFSQGSSGLRDDSLAFLKPWGFSMDEISMPVQLRVGSQDVNVPPSHSYFLNKMIPNSELLVVEDKNHFTILEPALADGFKWLRGIFNSRP